LPHRNYERFYKFCLLIDGIHKNINRLKVDVAPNLGVKSVHIFWVYELLLHEEGLTAAELASKTMISRSLISREIEDLYEQGYIDMNKTAHGKRKNYNSRIVLTEKGKTLARSISDLGIQIQFAADMNISEEELSAFYNTLEKISVNLCAISKEADIVLQDSAPDNKKSD